MIEKPVIRQPELIHRNILSLSFSNHIASMIETILMIIVAIAIAAILFFFLRNGLKLLINAVCGVVILFIVSYFNLAPIGDLSVAQVIVCAVGGILGAALLIILSFFGIVI
ncbi:hypothetical protein McpCs1_00210 [Methanocorpusculaceae archaeon Cs1]|uniref:SigmaK-factor processing regulatory BofA n=2 Tax=Methanocorpusculaceae TaxID=88404 RepID=A0AAE4MEI0_9EURY|nr:hypothetical protein [Methanocorpusculaceae archaeon Cs1]